MNIKNTLRLLCGIVAVGLVHAAQVPEDRVKLLSHTRRSAITYEWWLGASQASALPKWDPEKNEEPPLPLKKAIATAREAGAKGEKLESVMIASIPGADDAPPFNTVFYYRVKFKALRAFDWRVCVVMMDGTVLEPVASRESKKE